MFRPYDIMQPQIQLYWETYNPIIPLNILAVSTDTGMIKVGNGVDRWASLPFSGSTSIGNKEIDTSKNPNANSLLEYSDEYGKWIYRLAGCSDTESNWKSSTAIYGKYTLLIELDDITQIPTGRFKLGDGNTSFDNLPWMGSDFATSDFSVGESIEFNGSGWDPVTYLKPNELQSATTPTGLFHRDDGTWAAMDTFTGLETVEADQGVFGTVYVGGFPTEATTVTLTSDGTSLFVDDQLVWTQYNDGHGSGLDADTLDGHHSTAFTLAPASVTSGHIVTFGASPNILVDSEIDPATLATITYVDETFPTVPSTTISGNIVVFNSINGLELTDSGSSVSDFAEASHTHTESDISDLKTYVVYHGSSSDPPSTPSAGDEYYDTDDSKFYKYNGTDWIALN